MFQQAVSAVSSISNQNYNNTAYATYGYEYWSNPSHRGEGYITWFSEGKETWKITPDAVGADGTARISDRIIPEEPMVGPASTSGRRTLAERSVTVLDYELRNGRYEPHLWICLQIADVAFSMQLDSNTLTYQTYSSQPRCTSITSGYTSATTPPESGVRRKTTPRKIISTSTNLYHFTRIAMC